MDEKPNRFINIDQEKPLDDNGFSSVSNNIDDVDNPVNGSLEDYQNNQSSDINQQMKIQNGINNQKMNMPETKGVGKGLNKVTGGKWDNLKQKPIVGKAAQKLEDGVNNKLGLNKNKPGLNNNQNSSNTDNNVNQNVNHLHNQRINQENVPEGLKKAGQGQPFRSRTVNPNDINQNQGNQQGNGLGQNNGLNQNNGLGQNNGLNQNNGLEQNNGLNQNNESNQGTGLGAGLGLKSGLKKLNPLSNEEEKKDDPVKSTLNGLKKVKRAFVLLGGALASIPFVLPAIVLVVLVASIMGPISEAIGVVVEKVQELGQSFLNFFTGKGFKADSTLVKEFDEKINKVFEMYPEIDKESLRATLYYGFYSFEEFLESLDDVDDPDDMENFEDTFNYRTLRIYTFTVANQLIYSTVMFDNNIIQNKDEEDVEADFTLIKEFTEDEKQDKDTVHTDDNGQKWTKICSEEPNKDGKYECGNYKCKNDDCSGSTTESSKKVTYTYSCPAGSELVEIEGLDLCDDQNRGKVKVGDKETRSADYCINLATQANIDRLKEEDSNFNEKYKCVSYTFETGTEQSKQKAENFLKYVLVPIRYYDASLSGAESYSWKEFISKFPTLESEDKDEYNIPYHAVGPGKLDLFSSLSAADQLEADRTVKTILSLISATKEKEISDKYHIPGAASLPLDFTIKDTPEETIKSRVTSWFGPRTAKIVGESTYHHGIDFSASTGTPIYSAFDGMVVSIGNDSCGIWAKIGHDIDGDGNYDYYTRYCHMSQRIVTNGESVMNGQKIGYVGSTGVATGPHLHFEIWNEKNERINPLNYLIDIAAGKSELATNTTNITPERATQLANNFQNTMLGYTHTREGVARSAKFLVDNLTGLPNFCGGYTSSIIDNNWFTNQVVVDSKCSNSGTLSKYGLDNIGFINWAFTQTGYSTKLYTIAELKELGNRVEMMDASVKVGDIAYNGDNIGIIIEINDDKAVVAYVGNSGLTTTTVNRRVASSPFKYVVSLSNFYGE